MKEIKFDFSKDLNRKRIYFLIISILIIFISIFLESSLKDFIDSKSFLIKNFVVIIFLYFVIAILNYFKKYLETYLEKIGSFEGQSLVYDNVLNKKYKFIRNIETGKILYNLTDDMYSIMPWYVLGKIQYSLEILGLCVMTVFMLHIDMKLALVSLIFVLLSIYLSNKFSNILGKIINEQKLMNEDLNQFVIESIKSIGTIRQLNKYKFFAKKYDEYLDGKYKSIVKKVILSQSFYISQLVFSQEVIPFIVLFIGIIFTVFGKSTIGITIIMMDLTIKISKYIQSIGDLLPKKCEVNETYKRIQEFISKRNTNSLIEVNTEKFEKLSINIKGYKFENESIILKNVCFNIEKGDLCVIKGRSGSGKNTLFKLISKYLSLHNLDGEIIYNGKNIENLKLDNILYVEQNTVLIEGTLKENIFMGDNFLSEEFQEIIYTCVLEKFLEDKEDNFVIKEDGKNISGGEKQRIGLARMLIRKPEIVLLDEVTSALNKEIREELIIRLLNYSKKYGITIISISHNDDFEKYSNKIIYI